MRAIYSVQLLHVVITKESKKMAAISHGMCVVSFFLVLYLFLFLFVFSEKIVFFQFLCNTSMSFNPALFAELLRKHEAFWNSPIKNVLGQTQTTGSVRGSCKGDEDQW